MANKDDHKMRCSFCGKPQDMVYKLITGPGVCICDDDNKDKDSTSDYLKYFDVAK